MAQQDDLDSLFKGLKALSESTFPKKCSSCGKVYHDETQFVRETDDVFGKSGLKSSFDDDDSPIVELFRNCSCGSTLMDCFSERRDYTDKGLKRRDTFQTIMELLISRGMEPAIARQELLTLMKGGQSSLIEAYGVKFKRH